MVEMIGAHKNGQLQ